MERVISKFRVENLTTGSPIGSVFESDFGGRIIDTSNFGTMDFTVQWQEDLRGDYRTFVDSRVKPTTYKIQVLSDTYDSQSKLGDTIRLQLTRLISTGLVDNYCFGVLQSIERDRFDRNKSTRYLTTYEVYINNPFWWYGISSPPTSREETQMALCKVQTVDLSTTEQQINVTLTPYQTNVRRGIKLTLILSTDYTYTYPFDVILSVNGVPVTLTFTSVPTVDTVLFFGEGSVWCNCEEALKGAVRTKSLDGYPDFSKCYINPIQWSGETYTVGVKTGTDVTGKLTVMLSMIQGEYI